MFAWAQSTLDKISEAVAPPPTDGAGRYSYAVQRGEEDTAMGCIAEIDPVHTIVNQAKGLYPVHLACQYSLVRLVRLLFSQPGMMVDQTDSAGNTPLHHAAMSTAPAGLECVQLLIQEYKANVCAKNYGGQTPYDLATMNSIRQYLLPIQLQAETQVALDNGGKGLPPGIDLGGLRINNPHMPPPPTSFSGGPPAPAPAMPPPQSNAAPPPQFTSAGPPPPATPQDAPTNAMFGTPTPSSRTASAPASAPMDSREPHGYSRVGGSSAAFSGVGKYRADGFHSSSSDVGLQKKYGHAAVQRYVPPPPSSGNSVPSAPSSGSNPFAGGVSSVGAGARYGSVPARSRYVAYGPTASSPAASPAYPPAYQQTAAPAMPSNYTMFVPGGGGGGMAQPFVAPQQQQPQGQHDQSQGSTPSQQLQQQHQIPPVHDEPAAPVPAAPSTPYMPPPPYQMQNYSKQSTPSAYQQPGFISPAAATYGSPNTPGTLETPTTMSPPNNAFQSPQPASTINSTGSAHDLFSAPSQEAQQPEPSANPVQQASADAVFGAPPQRETSTSSSGAFPPSQPQERAPSASDVFGAPPQQQAASEDSNFAQSTTQPAGSASVNSASAPTASVQEQGANTSVPSVYSGYPSAQEPSANAANVFGSAPIQSSSAEEQQQQQPPGGPSAQNAFGNGIPAAPSPFAPSPMNISRAQSAEELFAEDAPPSSDQQLSTVDSNISETSKQLFGNTPHAGTTASDVFGAPQENGSTDATTAVSVAVTPENPAGEQNAPEPNQEKTTNDFGTDDDDGEMEDISLSQSPAPVRSAMQVSTPSAATLAQPPVASSAPADNSLFAAIGMPPPPLSSKKK